MAEREIRPDALNVVTPATAHPARPLPAGLLGRLGRGLTGPRLRADAGFTLIESVLGMMLFAIISVALSGLLTSAISSDRLGRERTLGEQAVNDQLEWIRQQPYDSIGTPSGNPPGTINATGLKNVAGTVSLPGLHANMVTWISYVADPVPSSYQTQADYKRVVVTLKRASDSQVLAREATYVAPPGQAPFGGINQAIINAEVLDMGSNTPVGGVAVSLATGPSAPRSDVTDPTTGIVTFPALTANPTSGSQAYYDLAVTPPTGYVALKDDLSPAGPAHAQLAPGQTFNTALRVYQPAIIYVNLVDQSTSLPYTGTASVTVSSSRGSQTFSYTGSQLVVTSIAGESVVPGIPYTVSTSTGFLSTPDLQPVPNSYPTDLTATFTVPGHPTGSVTATVKKSGGTTCNTTNFNYTISGGPYSFSKSGSGTTSASGVLAPILSLIHI